MSNNEQQVDSGNSIELDWLDENYIKKILETYENNEVNIKMFKKEPATGKCENYASAMHRIIAEYQLKNGKSDLKEISMIIKSRLNNELMSEIEEDFNVFEREARIYETIMKLCEKLLSSIGDDTKFGPRALYVDGRVIVQEDLKRKGYGILDIKEGLDYDHCLKVLEKVAKFHATTMVLYERDPKIFELHMKGNVTENSAILIDLYQNLIRTCIEYVETQPTLKKYSENLRNFSKEIITKLIEVFTRKENGFNVLNHGDLWVNNLMFKTDKTGQIVDVLLVDYQEGYFGSPGIDFNYFIYSSWKKDVFVNHKNDLIQNYYNVLRNTLEKLNYKGRIPTMDSVKREILAKGNHGLITTTCLRPILINEHPDLSEIVNFLSDTEETRKNRFIVFNNPKYGKSLELFLEYFVQHKIL